LCKSKGEKDEDAATGSRGLAGLTATINPAPAQASDGLFRRNVKTRALISVDGMHALDVANYVKSDPDRR